LSNFHGGYAEPQLDKVTLQDVRVEGGSVNDDATRPAGFGQRLPRKGDDMVGVALERLAEETLRKDNRERDGAVEVALGALLVRELHPEVLRRELGFLGRAGFGGRELCHALCGGPGLGDNGGGLLLCICHEAFRGLTRAEELARDAAMLCGRQPG
jgi:hypothetical protein